MRSAPAWLVVVFRACEGYSQHIPSSSRSGRSVAITLLCPGCKTRLTLGDDRAGTTLPCPKCGTAISAPVAARPVPPPRPATPPLPPPRPLPPPLPSSDTRSKPAPASAPINVRTGLWVALGLFGALCVVTVAAVRGSRDRDGATSAAKTALTPHEPAVTPKDGVPEVRPGAPPVIPPAGRILSPTERKIVGTWRVRFLSLAIGYIPEKITYRDNGTYHAFFADGDRPFEEDGTWHVQDEILICKIEKTTIIGEKLFAPE